MTWLFKRRRKNRRLNRENVLDVRLRTRAVRAARWRLVATSFSIALVALAGLFTLWRGSEWTLDRLVFSNSAFNVRRLQIRTDGHLPEATLRRWAGVRANDNLLALDLDQLRRDLERIPFIRSASLRRALPDTLCIEVNERLPIARVCVPRLRLGGGLEVVTYHLDAGGYIMHVTSNHPPELTRFLTTQHFPEFVGLDSRQLVAGRTVEARNIRIGLQLLRAFEQSPMFGLVELATLDVSYPEGIEVTTRDGGRILFGLENLELQLQRWRAAYDFASGRGLGVASLNLSVTNNVPLTVIELPDPRSASPVRSAPRTIKRHA